MDRRILALAVVLVAASRADAQGRIAGVVTAEGRPVAGATVSLADRRVITDSAGRYTIGDVPEGARQVQARLLGFGVTTQTVTVVTGQMVTADFALVRKAVQLEGIVTVGYGTQERGRLTGSVATVQAEQLAEIATDNPLKALQGRVAGVEIVAANNRPGAEMNMRIRGVRSLSASNEPLVVVDGIPIAGNVGDFSPDNIESIDVLKDAASTAIYGSRGANGVVLITTKSGSLNTTRTQFTADVSYGASRPLQLVDMMSIEEYKDMLQAAALYVGNDSSLAVVLSTPQMLAAYQAGQQTDWQRAILRTGVQRRYQAGLNGVSGNTRFNVSGDMFGQEGMARGQGQQVVRGAAAVDHTVGRLRLGINANAARQKIELGAGDGLWGFALSQTGFGLPYDASGLLITRPDGEPLSVNPIRTSLLNINEITRNRIFASMFSELQLLPGLKWRTNFGPDIANTNDGKYQAPEVTFPAQSFNRGSLRSTEVYAYTLDNMLQLNRNLGADHHVDATVLYGMQRQRTIQDSLSARNLPFNEQLWYGLNTGTVEGQYSNLQEWALESYMARANYTFRDRYTFMAAIRRDGSSRLAPGQKWTNFPSIGVAWQAGQESFLQNFAWLSALKLRGSYGVTGNTSIQPYQTQGALSEARYNLGPQTVVGYGPNPGNPANPFLTWEKTHELDVGADFGVYGDRVTGTIDWYRYRTKDLLQGRTLPAHTGYTSALQNIGETENNGLELQLSSLNVRDWNGVQWTMDLGWARNSNKIVRLAISDTTGCPVNARPCDINNGWFVGQPINVGVGATGGVGLCNAGNCDNLRRVWFDYQMIGIWQVADTAAARAMSGNCTGPINTCAFKPGEIRLLDANGDGRITPADRVIQGNTYPKWTGSVYNRVTWRSFDFSGLATIKWGYKIYDDFGVNNNQMQGRFGNMKTDYWTPDDPSSTQPAPRRGGNPIPYGSTRGYIDGSHWRIRNITVGYRVPTQRFGRFAVTNARVYATAQDPWIFTDYKGYDPENGTSVGAPAYRTLLMGATFGY